jgi:hypothetical protein
MDRPDGLTGLYVGVGQQVDEWMGGKQTIVFHFVDADFPKLIDRLIHHDSSVRAYLTTTTRPGPTNLP